jgi:hypothetical protein
MTYEVEKSENGGESESDADGRSVSVEKPDCHHKHKDRRRRSLVCIGNGSDAHRLLPHEPKGKNSQPSIVKVLLALTW